MSWREKAAAWLGKFMHVPHYDTFEEALTAQGVEQVENPLGVSDSISLKLTKGEPDAESTAGNPGDSPVEELPPEHGPNVCQFRPRGTNLDPSDING